MGDDMGEMLADIAGAGKAWMRGLTEC